MIVLNLYKKLIDLTILNKIWASIEKFIEQIKSFNNSD